MVDIPNYLSNLQNNSFFREIFEELNDLILILNSDFHIIYLNQKALINLTGFRKGDMLGKKIKNFINPLDLDKFNTFLTQISAHNKENPVEVKFKRKGLKKDYITLKIKGKQIFDKKNNKNILLVITKSSTERKSFPEESNNYEQRFRELVLNLSEIRFWKLLQPREKLELLDELKTMLQLILDNIPQYIAWKNKELIYLGCNNNFSRLFELNQPREVIGKTIYELVEHGDLAKKINKRERKVLESKQPEYHKVEKWVRSKDNIIYLDVNRIPIFDKSEEVIGILTTFEDVTKRKKAERSLERNRKRYKNLIETMNEGFFIQDKEGFITYVNDRFCKIFNLRRKESINSKFNMLLEEKDREYHSEHLEDIKSKKGKVEPYEIKWTKENGELNYGIISPQPLYDEEGNYDGMFAVITDITEQKMVDLKLKKVNKKYFHLLNNIPDTVVELDTHMNYTYVGPKGEEMFGFKPEQLVGTNALADIHPDDINNTMDIVAKEIRITGETTWEYRAKHKDGHYIPIRGKASLFFKDGNFRIIAILRDISEQKVAERKLKESEEKFRTITEQSLIGIFIIQDNVIKYANKGITDILGYSIEEILSWDEFVFLNKIHPKDKEFVKKQAIKKQRGDKDVETHYQFQCSRKDGTDLWLENYSKTIQYEGRKADLVTLIDVTEKKKAEEDLKRSERKYKDITELLPDIIYEANKQSFVTYLNPAGLKKFGFTEEDVEKGINIFEVIAPEHHKKAKKAIMKILNREETNPHEYKMIRKDGEIFYGLIHSRPIVKNDKVVGLRGVIHDITEKRKAEEKIRRSKEKFEGLFKGIPIPTYIWQKREDDFILTDFNHAAVDITENQIDDYLGIKASEMYGDKPDIVKDLEACFYNKEIIHREMRYHYKTTGEYKYLSVSYGFISPDLVLVHTKDITDEIVAKKELELLNKRLEQKVKQRTKELQRKNKELRKLDKVKSDFITLSSHQLKTPLISIGGYAEYIMMKHEDLNPEIKNDLKVILRNAKTLQTLMDQMLNVLKIDEEKLELQKAKLDLNQIIEQCLEELTFQIKKKNHKIIKEVPENAKIYADPLRIKHVFTNLFSNSIKFTQIGGRIEISAEKRGKDYLLSITDNGVGLTPSEIKSIFRKFSTIQQTRKNYTKEKGTGLGLYITKEIVEAHGGKIWGESEGRGKGSTFLFTIPLKKE
ncbi:MAG: PAS domain S-box protein [Promethearchaeia archaeon]